MKHTWLEHSEHALSRDSLELLLDNRIPAIRIPGFATAEECAALTAAANAGNMKYYNIAEKVGYIGMAQVEYRWDKTKADYFRDVQAAQRDLDWVLERSFNPIQRLMDLLAPHIDGAIGMAREAGYGNYFGGIIRTTTAGIALHADFAPFNSPGYAIDQIDAQLGWNLFTEDLLTGGGTTVHNAPWTPEMKPGEIPHSYGLDRSVVEGAETFVYAPKAGDVVLFNTRNPHEIAGGTAEPGRSRVSIGSFIGRMPNGDLVLWS